MIVTIHRMSLDEFTLAIIRESQRRRRLSWGAVDGRGNSNYIAQSAGYCGDTLRAWEKGQSQASLFDALNVLEACA